MLNPPLYEPRSGGEETINWRGIPLLVVIVSALCLLVATDADAGQMRALMP